MRKTNLNTFMSYWRAAYTVCGAIFIYVIIVRAGGWYAPSWWWMIAWYFGCGLPVWGFYLFQDMKWPVPSYSEWYIPTGVKPLVWAVVWVSWPYAAKSLINQGYRKRIRSYFSV